MPAVELSAPVWGRMATIAEDRGVTVADILVAAVHEVLQPRSRQERVLNAVRAGLPDCAVSEQTGELRAYVARVRRDAGLKPNRPSRQTTIPRRVA